MRNHFLGVLRRGVLICAGVLAASGCEPASQNEPQGSVGAATDPGSGSLPPTPGQEAGETDGTDDSSLSKTGLCVPAAKVYAESLPDSDVDATDLPLSPVTDFTLPTGLAKEESRQIFLSAAAFKTYFGVDPPASIDWSTQWVLFYSPGAVHPASQPKVVRARLRTASLRVTTTLTAPTGTCSGFPPGIPFTLVKFTAPALASCHVSYYHRTDSVPCPAVPAPGPSCSGTLTSAGLNNLLLTRPPARIDYWDGYSTRKGVSLGNGTLTGWQRTCASMGDCQPWQPLVLNPYLDHYKANIGYYLSYDAPSGIFDLYALSPRYRCDERGSGWCWGRSWIAYDIDRTGSSGVIHDYRLLERIDGVGDRPIGGDFSYLNLDSLETVVNDHCVLQQRTITKSTGPTAYTETLFKMYFTF